MSGSNPARVIASRPVRMRDVVRAWTFPYVGGSPEFLPGPQPRPHKVLRNYFLLAGWQAGVHRGFQTLPGRHASIAGQEVWRRPFVGGDLGGSDRRGRTPARLAERAAFLPPDAETPWSTGRNSLVRPDADRLDLR